MQRRNFLKAALAATVTGTVAAQTVAPTPTAVVQKTVAPGPLPWMKGLDHISDQSIRIASVEELAVPESQFFNIEQMKTLRRLSSLLMPPLKGKPGAVEAQTPEFLDFFIGKSSPEIQHTYIAGFAWLETEAKRKYTKPFFQLDDTQAAAIVKPHIVTWMPDQYPEDKNKYFLAKAHEAIRSATQNSQAWAEASGTAKTRPDWAEQLYWFPVEGDIA